MKKILMILMMAIGINGFAEYSFTIQPRTYLFSTTYDIYSGDTYLNSVENNYFQMRTVYSICDEVSEVASGTARLFSLGALSNSMREIDVVDNQGGLIGFIQGNWLTTALKKFAFFNENNHHIATAYLDRTEAGVTIVDPQNDRLTYAMMRRSYVPKGDYFWEVKVVKDDAIDLRMLQVFSAFITDACWPSEPSDRSITWEGIQTGIILKSLIDSTQN